MVFMWSDWNVECVKRNLAVVNSLCQDLESIHFSIGCLAIQEVNRLYDHGTTRKDEEATIVGTRLYRMDSKLYFNKNQQCIA